MERAIMLSLEKAKEFYAMGGEFRDLALGAYTEEELTKEELPKTWEEFCNNYPKQKHETYIGIFSTIELYDKISDRHHIQDKNVCPSQESAEAHLAMIQLEQLRDCYRQGWKPNYGEGTVKYSIYVAEGMVCCARCYHESRFLVFQDEQTAREFVWNFTNLILKAGDLI
jgi:hypothetical protein